MISIIPSIIIALVDCGADRGNGNGRGSISSRPRLSYSAAYRSASSARSSDDGWRLRPGGEKKGDVGQKIRALETGECFLRLRGAGVGDEVTEDEVGDVECVEKLMLDWGLWVGCRRGEAVGGKAVSTTGRGRTCRCGVVGGDVGLEGLESSVSKWETRLATAMWKVSTALSSMDCSFIRSTSWACWSM
jgi:hypothetical protein